MFGKFFKRITGIAAIEAAKERAIFEKEAAEELARTAVVKAAEEMIAAKEAAEKEKETLLAQIAEIKVREEAAVESEQSAKRTPKERATLKGEAWVSVLDTHVNKDNIKNGFFELDWNEEFILQLKQAGYGFEGDPDEQIVDRWFRDLATNMLIEDGQSPNRGAGYINIQKLPGGRAVVE